MYTKEQFLSFAFHEALAEVNLGNADESIVLEGIITGMHAYSDREGQNFTEKEMKEYAEQGLKKIKEAGDDFKLNDWSMPR